MDFDTEPNRILAFIDILGFSNIVKENDKEGVECKQKFKAIFDLINNFFTEDENANTEIYVSEMKFSWMSDTIVFSAAATDAEAVINSLLDTQHDLLCSGFAVRGAISVGRLYHQENIWGEALVRAAEIEKNYAKYPRILIRNEDYMKISLPDNLKKYFNDDSNGYKYIEPVSYELDRAIENKHVYLNLNKIFSLIETNYNNNSNYKELRKKWEWLAKITKKALEERKDSIQNILNEECKSDDRVLSYEQYMERINKILIDRED